jgi:hypothetical protein
MTVGTMRPRLRLALLLGEQARVARADLTDEEQKQVLMGLCPPPGWLAVQALIPDHAGSFKAAMKTVQALERGGYVKVRMRAGLLMYSLETPGIEAAEIIMADPSLSAIACLSKAVVVEAS